MSYRKQIALRQFYAVVAVIGLALAVAHFAGCQEAKEVVAASSYEAQQMACVDKYATKVDIDGCRAKVKLAWSTVDAGADAQDGGK